MALKKKKKAKALLLMPLAKLALLSTVFYHLHAGQSEQPFSSHLRACISLYMGLYDNMTKKYLVHLVVHCAPFISLSLNKPIGDRRNVSVWVIKLK